MTEQSLLSNQPKGGPNKIVPGRFARTLAEVWRLTPAEVAGEYERLKRFPNAALPRKAAQ